MRDLDISVRHFFASLDVDEIIAISGVVASVTRSIVDATISLSPATATSGDERSAAAAVTAHGPPLYIERFNIAPVRVTVSARASVRVYLSVDDAVLQFGAIGSETVICFPSDRVWRAVGER